MATANYADSVDLTLEIDYIGQRFGVFRTEDESLENFKQRILSVFIFENSTKETGYSAAIARSLGVVPKYIGYIEVYNGLLSFDGNMMSGTVLSNSILSKDSKIYDFGLSLREQAAGLLHIDDPSYLQKNMTFILPFKNFEIRKEVTLRLGVNVLKDMHIDSESIRSNSFYFQRMRGTVAEVATLGDFYFDGESTFIVYDNGSNASFQISYSKVWDYIPLFYCPVSVVKVSKFIDNMPFNVNALTDDFTFGEMVDSFVPTEEDVKIIWNCLFSGNIWKAHQNNPVSVNGTHYV